MRNIILFPVISLMIGINFLSAFDASAKPHKNKNNGHDNGAAWWKNGRRRPGVGNVYRSLPKGARRIRVRDRTYYEVNDIYFVFQPLDNLYVVVDPREIFD